MFSAPFFYILHIRVCIPRIATFENCPSVDRCLSHLYETQVKTNAGRYNFFKMSARFSRHSIMKNVYTHLPRYIFPGKF